MRALYSPEVYGSGKGVQEIAVWNLDGVDAPAGPPIWLVVLSAAIPVTLIAGLVLKEKKMAAKKKRGLSGTPAEHKRDASMATKEMKDEIVGTRRALKSGSCDAALDSVLAASHAAGEIHAHIASGAKMRRPGMTALKKAADAVYAKCMAPAPRKARKARR